MRKPLRNMLCTAVLASALGMFAFPEMVRSQSLEEEIEQLLESHPSILAATKSVASGEEGVNAAEAGYFPVISSSGDFGYERIDSPGRTSATPDAGPFTTGSSRQASVTVTQTLFNGWLTDADNANAELLKESAELNLEETTQAIMFEGVTIYLEVLRNLRLIKLAADNEATILRQLQLEDERVRRGAGITLDVLESKRRLQVAKERYVAFEGQLRDSRTRFNQVFGHEPILEDMIIPTPPLGLLPEDQQAAISVALETHPTIRRSENGIEVAQEQRNIAESAFYPTVDLVAEWGYEDDFAGTRGGRRDFSAKVKANWDIFDGFATKAGVARASQDYLASIDQTNFLKRKIGEELRLAWSGLTTARQRVTLLQNAVNIAAEVFNGRRKLRESGKETVINVLDAESGMFDARIQLVTAQHDARVAVYRLLAAMGQLNIDTITNISGLSTKRKIASTPRIEKKNIKLAGQNQTATGDETSHQAKSSDAQIQREDVALNTNQRDDEKPASQSQTATGDKTSHQAKSSDVQMQREDVALNTNQRDDEKPASQSMTGTVQTDIVIAKIITNQSVKDTSDILLLTDDLDLNFKRAWPYKQ